MKTVVILGAAGRVGDAAARAFVAAGWRVKGVARNARTAELAPGVEAVRADAFDRASLIAACRGADVILNALNPQYTEWAEKVMPMAENVIAAAQAVGATHMLPGNVYNFGYDIAVGTREDAPEVASTEKAEIRIAMEALFREQAEKHGVQTIVLRAGDFYGGTKPQSWLDLIILSKLRKNIFMWGGPADIPHAFAYLPDLGKAFVALAEKRARTRRFRALPFRGPHADRLADEGGGGSGKRPEADAEGHAVDAAQGRRPVQPDDARDREDVLSLADAAFARRRQAGADGRQIAGDRSGRRHPPGDRRSGARRRRSRMAA